jgi:hypothetical protein
MFASDFGLIFSLNSHKLKKLHFISSEFYHYIKQFRMAWSQVCFQFNGLITSKNLRIKFLCVLCTKCVYRFSGKEKLIVRSTVSLWAKAFI